MLIGGRVQRATACILAAVAGIGLAAVVIDVPPGLAGPAQDEVQHLLGRGENPFPVHLTRPADVPLSAMAQLGQKIFYDPSLSASGQQSCSSCHSPDRFYGPVGSAPAVMGGKTMSLQGVRAVPSLMYLERQPGFTVGPDSEENEDVTLAQMVAQSQGAVRATKTADNATQTATNLVPQGGLFWDGRADTLQEQALGPMVNPLEMANADIGDVAKKLSRTSYAPLFGQLFGPAILQNPQQLVSEALFAVGRYEIEDTHFHPYTSKFDDWLEGKVRLDPAEMRGYVLFNDPAKANCAGCHLDSAATDGTPPLFTDHQFEALGAPRNPDLVVNRDPHYFDLGVCGPVREDMQDQTPYCGMFLTPTLRNVASRSVFFHNGVFHTLQAVMDFYAFRDVAPEKVYPRGANGVVAKYNDIPARYFDNVDVADPPFDRKLGDQPAMTEQEEADIIAFLGTLTDGYKIPAATGSK